MRPPLEQQTQAWRFARCGKITASEAHCLTDRRQRGAGELKKRQRYRERLARERLTGEPAESFCSIPTEWGIQCEAQAIEAYELFVGSTSKVGFIPYGNNAGCSPDRLVGNDGLVEVKCPFNPDNHRLTLDQGMPAKHLAQVQSALLMTGRLWLDFVSFDPRQSPADQLYVERIYPNTSYHAMLEAEITAFDREVEIAIEPLMTEFVRHTDIDAARQTLERAGVHVAGSGALWSVSYGGLTCGYRPISGMATIFGQQFAITPDKLSQALVAGRLRPKASDRRYTMGYCKTCKANTYYLTINHGRGKHYDRTGSEHHCQPAKPAGRSRQRLAKG